MDNLTHSLTAYMLGRTGLNRWCPHASLVAVMGANAPDLDFVSAVGGELLVLECHRGVTHSLIWSPAVALIPLGVLAVVARRGVIWWRAWVVSLLGVVSHLLLDWTNLYGVRLLTPANGSWHRLDIASVVDLWVWGILLLAVAWLGLSRLVSGEIGSRAASGRGAALVALALMTGYYGARWVLHERATAVLDSRTYNGQLPHRVAAFPHFADPFRWRGLGETGNAYLVFSLNLRDERFDPSGGHTFYKPALSPAVEAAQQTEAFGVFLKFSQYPLWQVSLDGEREGIVEVQVLDLRFGQPGEDRFAATASVEEGNRVLRSWFQFSPPGALPAVR